MNEINSLSVTELDVDVINKAHELYLSTSNGLEDPNKIIDEQTKCIIALNSDYYKRDSEVVLKVYKDIMTRKTNEIPDIDTIAHEIFEINSDVFRCMAMVIYDNDDNLMCEAHHNAITECKNIGFDPDENSNYFAEIYVEQEHEVITSIAADLFNDYTFYLSKSVVELIEEVLDSSGCIYSPSKFHASSSYYHLYKIHKEDEAIPIINDCQEILIPELATQIDNNPDLRFMRLESGISC